jgi:hypothetical protein
VSTTADLHERLRAAITQRLETAEACGVVGGTDWTLSLDPDQSYALTDDVGWTVASGYMNPVTAAFIAANPPATVIRHCHRDLAVLDRHRPTRETSAGVFYRCRWCATPDQCPEQRDLAEAYQLTEEPT